jgi:dTDP-4-dehydrorhamnose reductase
MADVDRCQQQPAEAYRITVLTTAHLVSWIRDRSPGTRLTYVSTDHVYDGPGPHGEEVVRPGNVYALTKLWAEALAEQVQAHVVLRVNFFGPGGEARETLSDWLLRSLREGRSLRLFHDVYFSPLYVEHVADAIYECGVKDVRGTLNLGASGGGVSKAEFAALLADTFGLSMDSTTSGSVADARLTAYRPSDMRMRVDRLEARLGHRLPSIREGLALMRGRMEGSKT